VIADIDMKWLNCPECGAKMVYWGSDAKGDYYKCIAPHKWFEKLLDRWGLWGPREIGKVKK